MRLHHYAACLAGLLLAGGVMAQADDAPAAKSGVDLQWLQKQVPSASLEMLQATPLDGVWQIKLGSRYAYILGNGRYLLAGDLFDLPNNTNLTQQQRQQDTLDLLAGFPVKDMVVYPAKDTEKAVISVLTDTSCPYCRKLHEDVPQLQEAGVSVRYIPFPRGGTDSEGFHQLSTIWCAENPQQLMDTAMQSGAIKGTTDCAAAQAVPAGYQLGQQLKLKGTPTIIMPNGNIIAGYHPVAQLLQQLGLDHKP